jgi:ABC-type Fe3+ transport system permease subunit
VSFAYSHASGNAAASVTFAFLAFYCTIAGVLCLGRALIRGRKRLSFWLFPPRRLMDSQRRPT